MMKKRLFSYFMISMITFSVLLGSVPQTVSATSVSDNSTDIDTEANETEINIDTASITDVIFGAVSDNDITGCGHKKDAIEKYRTEHVNDEIHLISYPDNGTWGYDQTFARGEFFTELNNARMNPDNWWYLDENDERKSTTVTKKYEYDYELEAFAMQRAAELLISYTHKRPTGQYPQEILEEQNSRYQWARNYNEMIGFGPMDIVSSAGASIKTDNTASGMVYGFMEEYEIKSGRQTHRKCILDDKYYRIGIGVVKLSDETRFVAIEVAEDGYVYEDGSEDYITLSEYTEPVNGFQETIVPVATDDTICKGDMFGMLVLSDLGMGNPLKLLPNETYDINNKWFSLGQMSIISFSICLGNDSILFGNGWSSDNPSVATVENGVITAKRAGTALITCKDEDGCDIGGILVEVPEPKLVSVSAACSITSAPVGTTIYGKDVVLTEKYTYGSDRTRLLSEYGAYEYTVKEGVNVFTFEVNGFTGTFCVTGTKTDSNTSSGGNGSNVNSTQPVTPQPQPAKKVYTQKITVAKKFQKTYVVKYKTIKKSTKTYKIGAKVTTSGGVGHGKVTYKVVKYPKSAKKYISVSKNGKIALKKGAKKGTYKIRITAAAVKNEFKKATKTITIKVK